MSESQLSVSLTFLYVSFLSLESNVALTPVAFKCYSILFQVWFTFISLASSRDAAGQVRMSVRWDSESKSTFLL